MKMKPIELFCASPASTAICSSMEQYSMVRHGMKQIDSQKGKTHHVPCSSQLPFDPRPRRPSYQKGRKSTSLTRQNDQLRRKSSSDIIDLPSPPGSSKYLLSDISAVVPYNPVEDKQLNRKELPFSRSASARLYESPVYKLSSNQSQVHTTTSTRSRLSAQVVELRVSIHCKGCEGKVRKHLSKMEGVTSFSIDFASKKVTVIGEVTPLGVLASISKVKNAKFWPSSPTSSSSLSSSSISGRA